MSASPNCPTCGQPVTLHGRFGLHVGEGLILARMAESEPGAWVATEALRDAHIGPAGKLAATRQAIKRLREKLGEASIESRPHSGYRLSPDMHARARQALASIPQPTET